MPNASTRPDQVLLDSELERRIAELEASGTSEFDGWSWIWMLLLGVVLPIGLYALGWYWGPTKS